MRGVALAKRENLPFARKTLPDFSFGESSSDEYFNTRMKLLQERCSATIRGLAIDEAESRSDILEDHRDWVADQRTALSLEHTKARQAMEQLWIDDNPWPEKEEDERLEIYEHFMKEWEVVDRADQEVRDRVALAEKKAAEAAAAERAKKEAAYEAELEKKEFQEWLRRQETRARVIVEKEEEEGLKETLNSLADYYDQSQMLRDALSTLEELGSQMLFETGRDLTTMLQSCEAIAEETAARQQLISQEIHIRSTTIDKHRRDVEYYIWQKRVMADDPIIHLR